MSQVNIHEAKTQLSKIIDQACRGDEVVMAKAGTPTARFTPIAPRASGRQFGALSGKAQVDQRFFVPLPEAETMKDEYDFSHAEQGKFFVPAEEIEIPIYLDPDVFHDLSAKSSGVDLDVQTLVNDLLRKDIEIADRFARHPSVLPDGRGG